MSRRLKTNDDAFFLKLIQLGEKHTEAIIVVCEFEWLDEYFTIRGDG